MCLSELGCVLCATERSAYSQTLTSPHQVVEIAKQCTVIFNGIDHGEYFDFAVQSLCVQRDIPYCTASSYGHTALIESFKPAKVWAV